MSLDDRLAIAEDIISPFQLHGRVAIAAIREARARLKELDPKEETNGEPADNDGHRSR